jgi:orotate phosphoribosyltransferase
MAAPSRSSASTRSLAAFPDSKTARERLKAIIAKRSFGRGEITLVSGRKSNFYFNLKPTMLDPAGAALIAQLVLDALADEKIDSIGGLEMGAAESFAKAGLRFRVLFTADEFLRD